MDLKKAYYYIICLASLFVFSWGAVDLSSAAAGLFMARYSSLDQASPVMPEKESEPYMDLYYQKKILYDRLSDSLARMVLAGLIFAYSRKKVEHLEK